MRIDSNTSLAELATIISEALEQSGILATLTGGAAVTLYSDNQYLSKDLDFVTSARLAELKAALEPTGFHHAGTPRLSVFDHPECQWYLEFPPAPVSFGSTYIDVSACQLIETSFGKLRIITPTHSVMDRLIAAASWHEQQSLDQALLVAEVCAGKIDWNELQRWVVKEGISEDPEIKVFYQRAPKGPWNSS